MTTIFRPDEAGNVDFAESRRASDQGRVACFLHLRDLCYLHPEVAPAGAIAHMMTLAAAVIRAETAVREKRLADGRERAERQKAAAERAKAEQEKTEQYPPLRRGMG
jgi:hypothetical protein